MDGSQAADLQGLFWIVLAGLLAVITATVLLIRSGRVVAGPMFGGTPVGRHNGGRLDRRSRELLAPPRQPASATAAMAGRSSSSVGTRTRSLAGSTPK